MKKTESRMKGETWYYTPCGRRMKQFPEIIKVCSPIFQGFTSHNLPTSMAQINNVMLPQYLKRHQDSVVSREHFSFSPRMPIGDFYEERETPEVCSSLQPLPVTLLSVTSQTVWAPVALWYTHTCINLRSVFL